MGRPVTCVRLLPRPLCPNRHHLQLRFTDFDRPAFYELVNEPHWSFLKEPAFQQLHVQAMAAVKCTTPSVQVGGPCHSMSQFYRKQYQSFAGFTAFIDGTGAALDFYSFHAYDFLKAKGGDFNGGLITSGLPLEGVLDLVPSYTTLRHGRAVQVVLCGMAECLKRDGVGPAYELSIHSTGCKCETQFGGPNFRV